MYIFRKLLVPWVQICKLQNSPTFRSKTMLRNVLRGANMTSIFSGSLHTEVVTIACFIVIPSQGVKGLQRVMIVTVKWNVIKHLTYQHPGSVLGVAKEWMNDCWACVLYKKRCHYLTGMKIFSSRSYLLVWYGGVPFFKGTIFVQGRNKSSL